jgi:hypothetical protein
VRGSVREEKKLLRGEVDAAAMARVVELDDGKRMIPTIAFPDGAVLVEPTDAELATVLYLATVGLETPVIENRTDMRLGVEPPHELSDNKKDNLMVKLEIFRGR